MIQEVLRSIEGVAIFPLIGLFLCLGGFVVLILSTWRMRPGDVDYISRLPLDSTAGEIASGEMRNGDREGGRTES